MEEVGYLSLRNRTKDIDLFPRLVTKDGQKRFILNKEGDWDRPNGNRERSGMTETFMNFLHNLGISTPNAASDADFFSWLIRSNLIDAEVGKKMLNPTNSHTSYTLTSVFLIF